MVTMKYLLVAVFFTVLDVGHGESVSEPITTLRPTHFKYKAGRYPGHVDRVHEEASDGTGHVQGFYSFIDPKHKVRTVEYTADKDGFHPTLINYDDVVSYPADSEAVKLAKERHFRLYERIANANNQGARTGLPQDTLSVVKAKERHFELFNKIAQQHANIAAQREAERTAFEATSIVNDVQPEDIY